MGRIRTIKPEFFHHEIAAGELTVIESFTFIGLWGQADAAGRLEERPKRLAALLYPFGGVRLVPEGPIVPVDMPAVLDRLVQKELLVRYRGRALEHDRAGKAAPRPVGNPLALLVIPTFLDHQRPHPKEKTNFEGPPDRGTATDFQAFGPAGDLEAVAGVPIDRLKYDGPAHKGHAVCGRVCLPDFLCEQFAGALGGSEARARVISWALVMLRAAASLDAPIADPPVDWWRAAWREHVTGMVRRVGT